MGAQQIPHKIQGVTQEQIIRQGINDDCTIVRVVNDPLFDMGRGIYDDRLTQHVAGFNPTVPNGSWADIWAYGPTDPTYNWPTTDETFRVAAGGDVNDTSTGTGARTLEIIYLDNTGARQVETLTLNGAAVSSVTSLTGRRVVRCRVLTSGTYGGSNIGAITVENSVSGQIVAHMPAGVGQTQLSQFTIEAGIIGYVDKLDISVAAGTNKDADIRLWARPNAYTTVAPFGAPLLVRPVVPAFTDLWFEARGNGSTTSVSIDYDLICIQT
jgi:hypothetical protein